MRKRSEVEWPNHVIMHSSLEKEHKRHGKAWISIEPGEAQKAKACRNLACYTWIPHGGWLTYYSYPLIRLEVAWPYFGRLRRMRILSLWPSLDDILWSMSHLFKLRPVHCRRTDIYNGTFLTRSPTSRLLLYLSSDPLFFIP